MNLTPNEYALIRLRMLDFNIKYQEVYDELLDHVATGIEQKRDKGDTRLIAVILEDMIAIDLDGADGIKIMAGAREHLYHMKISRRVWKTYWHGIWWKLLLSTLITVLIGQVLPGGEKYTESLYGLIFIVLLGGGAFAIIKMRSIKLTDNRRSLIKTYVRRQIFYPFLFLNLLFTIPALISKNTGFDARTYSKVHPAMAIIPLLFILFYVVSCCQVMQEEMRAAKA